MELHIYTESHNFWERVFIPIATGIIPLIVVFVAHFQIVWRSRRKEAKKQRAHIDYFFSLFSNLINEAKQWSLLYRDLAKKVTDVDFDSRNSIDIQGYPLEFVQSQANSELYDALVMRSTLDIEQAQTHYTNIQLSFHAMYEAQRISQHIVNRHKTEYGQLLDNFRDNLDQLLRLYDKVISRRINDGQTEKDSLLNQLGFVIEKWVQGDISMDNYIIYTDQLLLENILSICREHATDPRAIEISNILSRCTIVVDDIKKRANAFSSIILKQVEITDQLVKDCIASKDYFTQSNSKL